MGGLSLPFVVFSWVHSVSLVYLEILLVVTMAAHPSPVTSVPWLRPGTPNILLCIRHFHPVKICPNPNANG